MTTYNQKKRVFIYGFLAIMSAAVLMSTKACPKTTPYTTTQKLVVDESLKKQAFSILKNKCNSCHIKKNPFMVFSEKNMTKRAPKINKQVFVLQRMPKKEGTPLTANEYNTLKTWIESL